MQAKFEHETRRQKLFLMPCIPDFEVVLLLLSDKFLGLNWNDGKDLGHADASQSITCTASPCPPSMAHQMANKKIKEKDEKILEYVSGSAAAGQATHTPAPSFKKYPTVQ